MAKYDISKKEIMKFVLAILFYLLSSTAFAANCDIPEVFPGDPVSASTFQGQRACIDNLFAASGRVKPVDLWLMSSGDTFQEEIQSGEPAGSEAFNKLRNAIKVLLGTSGRTVNRITTILPGDVTAEEFYLLPDAVITFTSDPMNPGPPRALYVNEITSAINAVQFTDSDKSDTPIDKSTLTQDPVNVATGELYFSSTDFNFNARGPKLFLSRRYRSYADFIGVFGYNWRTNIDINLSQDSEGNITIVDDEGTALYFRHEAGVYFPAMGNYSTLVRESGNIFVRTDKHGNVSKYGLDGRLKSVTDRNGNTLTFVYNPSMVGGTYIQDAAGRQIKLYFDSRGHVISAVDPAGHAFQYGYDTNGNLVSVIDPTGAVTVYTYDDHRITMFTNAKGHKTYYRYDAEGRVDMNWQDNNVNKVTLDYQPNNTTVVTDSLGHSNTYVFNDAGLQVSHIDHLGNVTKQSWLPNMERTVIADARGNRTYFVYDHQGNLLEVADEEGNITTMTYTPAFNLLNSRTDVMGKVTSFAYDIKGNLETVTDPLGGQQHFDYDQYGNVITATDTRNHSTHFTYDDFGNVLEKTNALGATTIFTYS